MTQLDLLNQAIYFAVIIINNSNYPSFVELFANQVGLIKEDVIIDQFDLNDFSLSG